MANVLKSFLDSLKLKDDDDDDEDEYSTYAAKQEEREQRRASRQTVKPQETNEKPAPSRQRYQDPEEDIRQSSKGNYAASSNSYGEGRKENSAKVDRGNTSKIIPIRTSPKGFEVCVMKPMSFEDSQDICDMLLSGRATVINLEGFDVDLAQRIMDFISGSVYAINGKLHQISGYIFIVSPDNVDISGDYLNMIAQNGFEVPTLHKDF